MIQIRGNFPLFPAVLATLIVLVTVANLQVALGQQYGGLRRSQSDTRLNRNSTFHRQSSVRDRCHTNYNFDYTQLTLQWAPGVCSTSPRACKREVGSHFTIHGMWPTIRGTQEPDYCCFDNTFDFKALEPIMKDLDEYWFSYFDTGSSRSFWAHEWLKHGTCARDIAALRGEPKYFGATLQMAKMMPILQELSKAGIAPDNSKPYQSSAIVKALDTISQGKIIQINCDYEHSQPIPLLTGVSFCFDRDLKPADCPEMRKKCTRQLIFPSKSTVPTSFRSIRRFSG